MAAAAWALALSYCTNYCYGSAERTRVLTWRHPYIANGDRTPFWERWAFWFHIGAIVWGVLALVAFIVGMIVVRNGIVRLGN